MTLPKFAAALAATAMLATPLPSFAAKSVIDVKALDTDNDGTVSLEEAKAAGTKKFEALDVDHDGTLDAKETHAVLTKTALGKADTDKDGTVDKAEYMAGIEAAFKKADTNNDGTLDEKELTSAAGETLSKMIQ